MKKGALIALLALATSVAKLLCRATNLRHKKQLINPQF